MTTLLTPDICVIGGGSGGLSVAAAAAAFGVSVVLIEKGKMGGDCLNYGCVPSKALLAAGKIAATFRDADKFGIKSHEPEVNFKAVHDHIHGVIGAIAPNDSVERFTALGVTVLQDGAQFTGPNTVVAGKHTIKARRFVISTGSRAFVPPITGLDDVDYFTNENIFDRTKLAKHLIIIGGGPIGMEMAQAHRRLGSEVTVIEAAKAFGRDDPELAAVIIARLREEGIAIHEGTKVVGVEKRGKTGIRVKVETESGQQTIDGSDLLVAVGRVPNVDSLGLDKAGVKFDRRGVTVGANLRSTNKKVYAIGDVAGGPQFTHVAGYHAGIVIRAMLFRLPAKANHDLMPWATYTDPELANVGLTEAQARERHKDIEILRWPYGENDRAQAEHKTSGFIKVVLDKKGRILGAGVAGAGAGEMINIWALALTNKMKIGDIVGYVPPYPTMAEIGKRAAVTHYASQTKRPIVRKLIGFLRKFG